MLQNVLSWFQNLRADFGQNRLKSNVDACIIIENVILDIEINILKTLWKLFSPASYAPFDQFMEHQKIFVCYASGLSQNHWL